MRRQPPRRSPQTYEFCNLTSESSRIGTDHNIGSEAGSGASALLCALRKPSSSPKQRPSHPRVTPAQCRLAPRCFPVSSSRVCVPARTAKLLSQDLAAHAARSKRCNEELGTACVPQPETAWLRDVPVRPSSAQDRNLSLKGYLGAADSDNEFGELLSGERRRPPRPLTRQPELCTQCPCNPCPSPRTPRKRVRIPMHLRQQAPAALAQAPRPKLH